MAEETTVAVRNACPANRTIDLSEYGHTVAPGESVQIPVADAVPERFPPSVWVIEDKKPKGKKEATS